MSLSRPAARIALLTLALSVFFTTAAAAATGSVNAVNVKFRQLPDTSSGIIELLDRNTSLEIVKTEGDWYQVRKGDVTGYVFAQYVTVGAAPAVQAVAASPAASADVPAASAQTAPGAAPVAPVAAESAAPVATTPAAANAAQAAPDAAAAPAVAETPAAPAETIVSVEANSLNIRATANAESEKLGQLVRGNEAVLLEGAGEWAKIRTGSGVTGYVLAKYLVAVGSDTVSRGAEGLAEELIDVAMSLRGVRYVYGGMSTKGFDCSGFVGYCYDRIGIDTPRSSHEFAGVGTKIARDALRPGDVLLWDTDGSRRTNISHVGIYLGNDKFIHASTSLGKVVVASVSGYQAKYLGARRLLD